jgi:LysM repeat protein
MARRNLYLLGLLCCSVWAGAQTDLREQYIEHYALLAVSEMERTGIPASIKLAQAILESRYGTSSLALESNNHFGIKCGTRWQGEGTYKKDDDRDSKGRLIPSCFRTYTNPEESFVAHSSFLQTYRRYEELFELDPDDYKGWAKGLKKAGYATSRSYHKDLINLIEELDLDQYDRLSSRKLMARMSKRERNRQKFELEELKEERAVVKPVDILVNNDVRYLVSKSGESIEDIANRAGLPVRTVIRYNEHIEDAEMLMRAGARVYLQPKRKNFRGRDKWHEVKPGESMFDIAQAYGIDLEELYERNRLTSGQQPKAGEGLKLRGWKVKDAPDIQSTRVNDIAANYRYSPVPPSAQKPQQTTAAQDTVNSQPVANPYPNDPFGGPGPMPETETPQKDELDFEVTATPGPGQNNTGGSAVFHTVVIGDTLTKLSKDYKVSIKQLRDWNDLKESDIIKRGMRLRVR